MRANEHNPMAHHWRNAICAIDEGAYRKSIGAMERAIDGFPSARPLAQWRTSSTRAVQRSRLGLVSPKCNTLMQTAAG